MKRSVGRALDIATWAIALAAIAVVGVALWNQRIVRRGLSDDEVALVNADSASVIGDSRAPIRITEFSDPRCGHCAAMVPRLRRLIEKYPDHVAVAYRHSLSERAEASYRIALAMECAGSQGKFERFHDSVFSRLRGGSREELTTLATSVGVGDAMQFARCLDSERFASKVNADISLARKLRISGTPTYFLRGRRYLGELTDAQLEQIVAAAIRDRRAGSP